MANIIIPSKERKEVTENVMKSYGIKASDRAGRELAEVIAARSIEAKEMGRKGENKR